MATQKLGSKVAENIPIIRSILSNEEKALVFSKSSAVLSRKKPLMGVIIA